MRNAVQAQSATPKQSYATLDVVMQEVVLAEEETLKAICSKLQEGNPRDNPKIISVLQDWGKVPAAELKERALRI